MTPEKKEEKIRKRGVGEGVRQQIGFRGAAGLK